MKGVVFQTSIKTIQTKAQKKLDKKMFFIPICSKNLGMIPYCSLRTNLQDKAIIAVGKAHGSITLILKSLLFSFFHINNAIRNPNKNSKINDTTLNLKLLYSEFQYP